MKQIRHADGSTQPYFTPQEIRAAMQLANMATQSVEQQKPQSPGSSQDSPGARN